MGTENGNGEQLSEPNFNGLSFYLTDDLANVSPNSGNKVSFDDLGHSEFDVRIVSQDRDEFIYNVHKESNGFVTALRRLSMAEIYFKPSPISNSSGAFPLHLTLSEWRVY